MDEAHLRDAQLVLSTLNRLNRELADLRFSADSASEMTPNELSSLKGRFGAAKTELKLLAKTETVDGKRRQLNHFECAFFAPAVRTAAVSFRLHVNAPPHKWPEGLFRPSSDLNQYIRKLEVHLEEFA